MEQPGLAHPVATSLTTTFGVHSPSPRAFETRSRLLGDAVGVYLNRRLYPGSQPQEHAAYQLSSSRVCLVPHLFMIKRARFQDAEGVLGKVSRLADACSHPHTPKVQGSGW